MKDTPETINYHTLVYVYTFCDQKKVRQQEMCLRYAKKETILLMNTFVKPTNKENNLVLIFLELTN